VSAAAFAAKLAPAAAGPFSALIRVCPALATSVLTYAAAPPFNKLTNSF
jgi:hypothetical protein